MGLIDATKAIESIDEIACSVSVCISSDYSYGMTAMKDAAIHAIEEQPTVDAVPVDAIETYIAMLKEAECTQSARVIENMLKEIGIEPKSERPKSDRSDTKDAMEQEGER